MTDFEPPQSEAPSSEAPAQLPEPTVEAQSPVPSDAAASPPILSAAKAEVSGGLSFGPGFDGAGLDGGGVSGMDGMGFGSGIGPWWGDAALASASSPLNPAGAGATNDAANAAPAPEMGHRPTSAKMGAVWDSNRADLGNMNLDMSKAQKADLEKFKKTYAANMDKYEAVSKQTGIPPMLIAAIHYRESSMNFGTYLHQGDKLGKPAVHVPSNIPVFDDWGEAAVHALNMKKSLRDQVGLTSGSADPVAMATFAEGYNGLGYHNRDLPSPYLYAGSDRYESGMYVADGKFDANAKDKRLGVMTILQAMQGFDPKSLPADAGATPAPSAGWQKVIDGQSIIKVDARGDTVHALQERLSANGLTVETDGKFGPATKAAVIAFQKAHGLKPDGIVGPATSTALQSGADKAKAAKAKAAAGADPATAVGVDPAKVAQPGTATGQTQTQTPAIAATATGSAGAGATAAGGTTATATSVAEAAVSAEKVTASPEPVRDTKPADVVVSDPAKPEASVGKPLSPAEQQQHLSEITGILEAKWGSNKLSRDGKTDETSAKLVQRSLVELGYLPAGTAIDGKWGPLSQNALMAFQVATSGVDTIEKGRDKKGNPIYMTDKDDPRLKGIVGDFNGETKKKLIAALEAQKGAITKDGSLPELKIMHELGDTPEAKAAFQAKAKALGMDPAALQSVDVNAYSKLGLRPHVLAAAVDGWKSAVMAGKTTNSIVTVTDYELPANMRRSFTIDLSKGSAAPMFQQVMAHGSGSDSGDGSGVWSTKFGGAQSDGSHQSMLGGFVAGGETYQGSKISGTHVEGIEKGINDQAAPRLVRTHAPTNDTWNSNSIIGRNMGYHSWGCMVYDRAGAAAFKKMTESKGGTYMFNFAPNEQYWSKKPKA